MREETYRPALTDAGLTPTHTVDVTDEYGRRQRTAIAGERPLTLYLDKREIVTLMTLGNRPEVLALGYLRNQGFVERIEDVKAVQVDWETESAAVVTVAGVAGMDERMSRRTVTSGCGQGTVFGDMMEKLDGVTLPALPLRQSQIYELLRNLNEYNQVYREAGAVHGCALCRGTDILMFVEDVGRHNAADAIAGYMWLERMRGDDKIFYTTGRLTSEMVIKVAQMGIPALLSRSGVTQMGFELAHRLGVTMIARAKGRHFLIFNGAGRVELDAQPPLRAAVE